MVYDKIGNGKISVCVNGMSKMLETNELKDWYCEVCVCSASVLVCGNTFCESVFILDCKLLLGTKHFTIFLFNVRRLEFRIHLMNRFFVCTWRWLM